MTKMDSPVNKIPDLEPRFLQPPGWRWHMFTNEAGHKLRFGTISPKSRVPDAVVVVLPGLSEFAEKYFELAHNFTERNLAVWILDWEGQGKSDRLLSNRQKRHSNGFDADVADLHSFMMEYVKHASVHPDVGRIPMVMLAHSMGANIGMRYLLQHPEIFTCAAFSAPMAGIHAVDFMPLSVAVDVSNVLNEIAGTSYVFGGKDWRPEEHDPKKSILSHDQVRAAVYNAWCRADPQLQVGDVTYGWVNKALHSCYALQNALKITPLKLPCLFALAGEEKLVSNKRTRALIKHLPNAITLDLPGSRHEILMETDEIRNTFIEAFIKLLADNNIREKLQRF
jgi:lysophospholipase